MRQPGKGKEAIPLLRQANEQWRNSGDTSGLYAESMDSLALLLSSTAAEGSDAWRTEAMPLAEAALRIRDANPGDDPAWLALALEIEADTLGRPGPEADAFWKRAQALRAQKVAAMPMPVNADPSTPPIKIGNGVSGPALVGKSEPEYSRFAIFRKTQGSVLLAIVIGSDGSPRDIRLLRGIGYGLDEKAAEAVSRWRFRPGQKDGQAVAVQANVEVNFRLLTGAPTSR